MLRIFQTPLVHTWSVGAHSEIETFSKMHYMIRSYICACFWCQSFCDVSPYVCSYYFSSILVAEWPPFGKNAYCVGHFFSLYFVYF